MSGSTQFLRPPRPESFEAPLSPRSPRGPESLYYDMSKWTDSCKTRIREKSIERIERGWIMEERRRSESRCSSAQRTDSTEPGSSMTGSFESGPASSFESDESVATQPTQPKVFRLQPRICVMCDHAWRAKIPETRSFMLKCPNCLSDQPGEDNLTAAELRAQADKCNEVLAARDAEAAKKRKEAMAERARLRRYDQPWTPQLASQHNYELARAHEREQGNYAE